MRPASRHAETRRQQHSKRSVLSSMRGGHRPEARRTECGRRHTKAVSLCAAGADWKSGGAPSVARQGEVRRVIAHWWPWCLATRLTRRWRQRPPHGTGRLPRAPAAHHAGGRGGKHRDIVKQLVGRPSRERRVLRHRHGPRTLRRDFQCNPAAARRGYRICCRERAHGVCRCSARGGSRRAMRARCEGRRDERRNGRSEWQSLSRQECRVWFGICVRVSEAEPGARTARRRATREKRGKCIAACEFATSNVLAQSICVA